MGGKRNQWGGPFRVADRSLCRSAGCHSWDWQTGRETRGEAAEALLRQLEGNVPSGAGHRDVMVPWDGDRGEVSPPFHLMG